VDGAKQPVESLALPVPIEQSPPPQRPRPDHGQAGS
jgi:hypothetical protein